jgi:N-methylhydantoinase B
LSIIDPTIPANFGVYKPITIAAPEGTVVNALPPAPVVGRNAVTHTIVNALMLALSEIVPERITAGYYGMSNVYILSGDGTGDIPNWILFDIEVGGGGGRQTKDGLDCYSQGIHNLRNTPIEMIEGTYPLRFTHYEFLPDTGGAGRQRGGLGVRRDIEFLDKSGAVETQFDKFKVAPFGLFGGKEGATGQLTLNPDAPNRKELPSKNMGLELKKSDILSIRTQGGGGYGPANERSPELIERDVLEGKVTLETSKREYGRRGLVG